MAEDRLISLVLERIRASKPGARLPSARHFADEAGVSRARMNAAVEHLIGSGALRREGLRLFAGVQRKDESFTIHIFSSEERHLEPARAVVEALGGQGIVHAAPESGGLRRALLEADQTNPDGILMWYPRNLDILEDYEAKGVATVLCGDTWPGHNYVSGDNARIAGLAVHHLAALGHREIALVIRQTRSLFENLVESHESAYRAACTAEGLGDCASRIEVVETDRETRDAWSRLLESANRPTAIVCSDILVARQFTEVARESGVRVPAEVSLLSLMERAEASQCEPPLTTVGMNESMMSRLAAFLLCEEIRLRRNHTASQRRQAVACEPALTIRGSTAPPASGVAQAPPPPRRWPDDKKERLKLAAAMNRRRHAGIGPGTSFRPLDLGPHVNRGLTPRSAWLGDQPLRHFEPGNHQIHGVPFLVARGAEKRHSVIVLRSAKARTTGSEPLPLVVTIPVGGTARSIFLLHAAGWTVRHEAFARYEFQYADGCEERLDVVSYTQGPPKQRLERRWREASSVQDWHPGYPVFDSSCVLPWLISEKGDPLLYERYLYTCRWVNPHPEKTLECIRLRSLLPDTRATLAVLAITLET